MDKKRQAKLDYKDNPPEMGVLAFRNTKTGSFWLTGTGNLEGKINSIKFQLEMGSFIDKAIQKEWDAGNKEDFTFEVLEVLKPDKSPDYDYRPDLKLLAKAWFKKLKS